MFISMVHISTAELHITSYLKTAGELSGQMMQSVCNIMEKVLSSITGIKTYRSYPDKLGTLYAKFKKKIIKFNS